MENYTMSKKARVMQLYERILYALSMIVIFPPLSLNDKLASSAENTLSEIRELGHMHQSANFFPMQI